MSEAASIEERVMAYLLSELPAPRRTHLRPDTALFSSGLLDSLAFLRLVSYLQAEFGVRPQEIGVEVKKVDTIAVIAALVRSRPTSGR